MHDTPQPSSSLRTHVLGFFLILLFFDTIVAAVLSTYGRMLEKAGAWPWGISLGQISGAAIVLVNLLLIAWYIEKKLQPLEELSALATRLGKGDLYSRTTIQENTEIGQLAHNLNVMADRITEQIESLQKANELKQEFIAISSHNLQTPLIVIRGYLEQVAKSPQPTPEHIQKALDGIAKQTTQLNYLVKRLLEINQLQGELISLHKHNTDFVTLTQDAIKKFEAYARSKDITISFVAPDVPVTARFDPKWIVYVWENLLDNAVKFTSSHGTIKITIGNTQEGVFGEILDTGIGIPEAEQEQMFLPFHRAQEVLDASYAGVGLGLYGAKLVIDRHQGSIRLHSLEGGGTTVRFTLPQ